MGSRDKLSLTPSHRMKYALGNMLNGAGGLNADQLALDLQFAADKTMTARKGPTPVFTRASSGTFVGSNGLIQTAATNIPRFDHTSAGVCRGLLIEESRTNLYSRSEEFNNTFWAKTRSSITVNATTAPDGTLTADKLVEDATASNTHIIQSAVTPPATAHTLSIFAKKGERNFIALRLGGSNDFFNLNTGVAITNINSPTITNFGNGWYRCTVTSALGTQGSYRMSIDGITDSYTGDGTSGIFIWGAQLEAGSFATSYIPTTTGTLARSADVCSITGGNFTSFYNQSEGAFLSNSSQPFITVANAQVYAADNGSDAERFNLRHQTSFAVSQVGGVTQSIIDLSDPTANAVSKIAYAYANANYGAARNGTLGASTPNLAVPTVNRIFIGSKGHNSSEYLNGHISAIRYYKKRLPNAKLQALTV